MLEGLGAGLAVSVRHDETGRLMPPVKHQHQQQVPQLVAGAQVVELTCRDTALVVRGVRGNLYTHKPPRKYGRLTWEVALRNFGNVEDERQRGDEVHDQDPRNESLKEQR